MTRGLQVVKSEEGSRTKYRLSGKRTRKPVFSGWRATKLATAYHFPNLRRRREACRERANCYDVSSRLGELGLVFSIDPFGELGKVIKQLPEVKFDLCLRQQVRVIPDEGEAFLQLESRRRRVIEDGILAFRFLKGCFQVEAGKALGHKIKVDEILRFPAAD